MDFWWTSSLIVDLWHVRNCRVHFLSTGSKPCYVSAPLSSHVEMDTDCDLVSLSITGWTRVLACDMPSKMLCMRKKCKNLKRDPPGKFIYNISLCLHLTFVQV